MKNLLTLCLLLLSFPLIQAATLTVNNTNATVGQYSTVQAAVNAAASGDTILIQGSEFQYAAVELPKNKPLTLRGGGWNPSKRPSPYKTRIQVIALEYSAQDITIEGLQIDGIVMNGIADNFAEQHHVKVQFCSIGNLNIGKGCHDFIIQNNYIGAVIGHFYTSNILFQNNILNTFKDFGRGYIISISNDYITPQNVRIDHNTFLGGDVQGLENLIITNNIFSRANVYQIGTLNIISNNLTHHPYAPSYGIFFSGNQATRGNYLTANIIGVDPLFVDIERDYHLQPNSPAKNAGSDGKDLGMYTTFNSVSQTGEVIPSVRVFELNSSSVTTPNGTINIKMTASKARDGN